MSAPAKLAVQPARAQAALETEPYDRWLTPDGGVTAEFHRHAAGILLRFPDQADFVIPADLQQIVCTPVPDMDVSTVNSLFENSVRPAIGNHAGSLNLHGSAVVMGGRALAIMGYSRRGKTTLAGALAREGFPFLTEDVLALSISSSGYLVSPQRAVLRVFADSAAYLLNSGDPAAERGEKRELAAGSFFPSAEHSVPLGAICILGPGETDKVSIRPLDQAGFLAEIMQHSFILDVEDRTALREHFDRLAGLAGHVPCYLLDYPRDFSQLPTVVEAISDRFRREWASDADK